MGPIVKELAKNYSGKSVKFVTFDFTNDESKAAAKKQAKALGVEGTFGKNAPNTGFALIYGTKDQKIVAKLTAGDESEKWKEVLDGALGGS